MSKNKKGHPAVASVAYRFLSGKFPQNEIIDKQNLKYSFIHCYELGFISHFFVNVIFQILSVLKLKKFR